MFLLFGTHSKAQIVAWEFNGNAGNEVSVAATSLDSNLQTSSISRGAGLAASNLANSFSSNNFSTDSTTLEQAILDDDYLTFSISPQSGYQVSLSTLDVNFRRSSTGPNTFQWAYSIDGFTTNNVNIGSEISFTSTATDGVAQSQISLAGISALQSITGTATFRLYGYGSAGGTFAIGRLTGNDLSINGIVTAVPEPSTYAAILGGVALVGVMAIRRRKPAANAA